MYGCLINNIRSGAISLRNKDFEFPDLLGAAYEYLIAKFADSAGKKIGEFYTPRSVVRMMVRLLRLTLEYDIYDSCCGSGGMLIAAKEFIDEHGQGGRKANLFGQENAGTVWSIAKMNMLLHGICSANLHNDDTLAEPKRTVENGELHRFDRILTNPPFSLPWGSKERTGLANTLAAQVSRTLLPRGPARSQEGRPHVPPAHAAYHQPGRRHNGDRHAAWRPVSCWR